MWDGRSVGAQRREPINVKGCFIAEVRLGGNLEWTKRGGAEGFFFFHILLSVRKWFSKRTCQRREM